jgi:hypothetical protein
VTLRQPASGTSRYPTEFGLRFVSSDDSGALSTVRSRTVTVARRGPAQSAATSYVFTDRGLM